MKKVILIIAIVALSLSASAQKFGLIYEEIDYTDGQTIAATLPGDGFESVLDLYLKNLTNQPINGRMRIDDVENPDGISLSICIGQCVPGNLSSPFQIDANSTYPGECAVHFTYGLDEENPATHGLFLINVYDTEHAGDTLKVYVDWKLRTNGIAEVSTSQVMAFPNPSHGQVTIDCLAEGILVVRDVMGRQVLRQPANGPVALQLAPGLYSYGLEGQPAKKLIVR